MWYTNIKTMTPSPYFVYILECSDGTLYTGIATDAERRFAEHAAGKGSKYVHAHGAKRIAYRESASSRNEALQREAAIKRLSKKEKLGLMQA